MTFAKAVFDCSDSSGLFPHPVGTPDPQHDSHQEDERNVGPHVGVFVRVEEGLRDHDQAVQHAGQDAEIEQRYVATRVFGAPDQKNAKGDIQSPEHI